MLYCNTSQPKQYYFQDSGSEVFTDIIYLNDYIQFYLLLMLVIITWIYIFIIYTFINNQFTLSDLNHGSLIEIIWTVTPCIILILIAIPGFRVLYTLDQIFNADLTIKCIASQWYWTYQLNDYTYYQPVEYSFDSYMIATNELLLGDLRLLQVDQPLLLPVNKLIRLIVTSTDVIHSFSVPSLGIKIDAVPGRINQTSLLINRYGTFYGACQEICGIQHAFMPIKIIATSYDNFITDIININSNS